MLALQVGSYGCMWAVQRVALRTRRWGPGDHLAAGLERLRAGGAGRRGGLGRACSTRCSRAAGMPAGGGGLRDDRIVGARVRHAVRAAACSPFRRSSAARRWTRASSAPPAIGAVVFVLMFVLGAACVLLRPAADGWSGAPRSGCATASRSGQARRRPARAPAARARRGEGGARPELVAGADRARAGAGCSTTPPCWPRSTPWARTRGRRSCCSRSSPPSCSARCRSRRAGSASWRRG